MSVNHAQTVGDATGPVFGEHFGELFGELFGINRYLQHLSQERGLSVLTTQNYRRELARLHKIAFERGAMHLVDERAVRKAISSATENGIVARTIALRLSAWRGYFDWALLQSDLGVQSNPCRSIKAPKAARRLPKALSADAAIQLMETASNCDSIEGLRNAAICELLYSSGLRVSELVSLDSRYFDRRSGGDAKPSLSWIDLSQAQANVLGKGNKRRAVPIGSVAVAAIKRWLDVRNQFAGAANSASTAKASKESKLPFDEQALFIGSRGQRITARAVQRLISTLGIQAGTQSRVHPHVLRHSFASHILQSSSDLRAVQELLGHASITTTQVYTSLDFQRLSLVYDAAHPRAKLKPQLK